MIVGLSCLFHQLSTNDSGKIIQTYIALSTIFNIFLKNNECIEKRAPFPGLGQPFPEVQKARIKGIIGYKRGGILPPLFT
jgi:hypothetical protein